MINKQNIPEEKVDTFECKKELLLNFLWVNDLVSDCEDEAEDEVILQDILVNHTYYPCPRPDQIHCKDGHPKCFYIHEICLYRLNKYNHLIPCRTGGHIEQCEQFECNMKY